MTIRFPAFRAPVEDAQLTFRALMAAMSFPGEIGVVASDLAVPAPADPALGAVLLTLLDAETSAFLAPEFTNIKSWLAFHSGTALIDDMTSASFVVASRLPDLRHLNGGTEHDPETSTTLILQIRSLRKGCRFELRGPGIERKNTICLDGLPPDFASIWVDQQPGIPRGIDLILCSGTEVMALPRTVSIGVA